MPINAKVLGRLGEPSGPSEVLIRERMAEKPTVPPEPPPPSIPVWSSFGYTSASNVVIASGKTVLLDGGIADCNTLTIDQGGTLLFSKTQANHLRLRGNLIVSGVLEARTTQSSLIQWVNISEAGFVGGHTATPLSTDPGLWVQDHGDVKIEGKQKTGWLRANAGLSAGATTLTLQSTPVGWEVGDEIAIVPTESPTVANHYDHYDIKTIATITGAVITWSGGLTYAHPAVTLYGGTVMTAEVLNLTRSFRIEGEAGKRAHIIFNGHTHDGVAAGHAPILKYFAGRYLGPQRAVDINGNVAVVPGRYGLHIHLQGDGSRGALIEGAVMRDIGNHGFVGHGSNGITFRDCVIHNGYSQGFWWDPVATAPGTKVWANASSDQLWDKCVSSRISVIPQFRGGRASHFHLSGGTGNISRDCVAVGMQQSIDASGMQWPEGESVEPTRYANPFKAPAGVWPVEGFVVHNNRGDGLFVWQNTENNHEFNAVAGKAPFIAYHCGGFGWDHGAYSNPYKVRDSFFHGNTRGGRHQRAMANNDTTVSQVWQNNVIDGAGIALYCVEVGEHTLNTGAPRFIGERYRGFTRAAIFVGPNDGTRVAGKLYIQDPVFELTGIAVEFLFDNAAHPGTYIIVRSATLGNFTLRHPTYPSGTFVARWNAKKTA